MGRGHVGVTAPVSVLVKFSIRVQTFTLRSVPLNAFAECLLCAGRKTSQSAGLVTCTVVPDMAVCVCTRVRACMCSHRHQGTASGCCEQEKYPVIRPNQVLLELQGLTLTTPGRNESFCLCH